MVKKLFKHEILAYLRVWVIMQAIVLAVAAFGRIIQFFETDTFAYNMTFGSSVFAYVISIMASFGFVFVFAIVRFYKNLFTNEGYLSFTLPVTAAQHIWVKLLTAVLFTVLTLIVTFLSFALFTAGEVFAEVMKAAGYLLKEAFGEIGPHLVVYIFEYALLMIVAFFTSYLLYYTCIAIGQTAKKNRVLAAVGVYFLYYIIMQVIATVFVILLAIVAENITPEMLEQLEPIFDYFAEHPHLAMHLTMCASIIGQAIMTAIYFAVTHLIIKKKLNLE